jgi:hypothetical protein
MCVGQRTVDAFGSNSVVATVCDLAGRSDHFAKRSKETRPTDGTPDRIGH